MPICPDCQLVKKLEYHHDPPKSRRFKGEDGHTYFRDIDGTVKPLKTNKNRMLCRKCHNKADKKLGLPTKYHKKVKKCCGRFGGLKN